MMKLVRGNLRFRQPGWRLDRSLAVYLVGLTACFPVGAVPLKLCSEVLVVLKASPEWETPSRVARWLHRQDDRLHVGPGMRQIVDELGLAKPADKIAAWAEYWKVALAMENPRARLRDEFLGSHVISAQAIPEGFFRRRPQIERQALSEAVIEDQRASLARWFDYLASPEAAHYPAWARARVLTEVATLSKYDPARGRFPKRDKTQIAPFPELNHEALAHVVRELVEAASGSERKTFSFSERYAWHLSAVSSQRADLAITAGLWRRFEKGSPPDSLVKALAGRNTGWCTAEAATAKKQLELGDFHVFFSLDREGAPTVPRIAIRMEGPRLQEVRGIGSDQNLDPAILASSVLNAKLVEFGEEGTSYQRRSDDLRRLDALERKHRTEAPLSRSELRFLYELDARVEGFGLGEEPRLEQIRSQRNKRKDLVVAIGDGITERDVSLTTGEALSGSRFHYGSLDLSSLSHARDLKLPDTVWGSLNLSGLRSADGLTLPRKVMGNLRLERLPLARGLALPETLGGSLHLDGLKSAEGLTLPDRIPGAIYLFSLTSAAGLKLPQHAEGSLFLSGLTSAEGLVLPETVRENLDLSGLTSAKGLKLPEVVSGSLFLIRLVTCEGLKLPSVIGGGLYLSNLLSAEGIKFPDTIGGSLDLKNVTSARGLVLPDTVRGCLRLSGLRSTEGLKLPRVLTGGYVGPPL